MFSKPKACFNLTFKKINMINSECSICYDDVEKNNLIKTNCNHTYCISCFKQYLSIKSNDTFVNNISCPYCRQHIHCLSLNDEEEIKFIKNEYCNIYKYFNIFEPVSVYEYHDIYNIVTIGDFELHDIPEAIVVYPIVVYILLFSYVCFSYICLKITLDIYVIDLLIKLAIIARLWYLLYQIISFYYLVKIEHYCFITWLGLGFVGIYTIIY
jgi:hypothetical protein